MELSRNTKTVELDLLVIILISLCLQFSLHAGKVNISNLEFSFYGRLQSLHEVYESLKSALKRAMLKKSVRIACKIKYSCFAILWIFFLSLKTIILVYRCNATKALKLSWCLSSSETRWRNIKKKTFWWKQEMWTKYFRLGFHIWWIFLLDLIFGFDFWRISWFIKSRFLWHDDCWSKQYDEMI